jgi:hypothetical protein
MPPERQDQDMANALTKRNRPDPTVTYVAIQSFAADNRVIPAGTKLLGSHPAVQAAPGQ